MGRTLPAPDGGSCDEERPLSPSPPQGRLILMSDCYYHNENLPGNVLERSLRALIQRGGCRMVVASWKVRNHREQDFLHRLRDLGTVLPSVRFANSVYVGALKLTPPRRSGRYTNR